MTEGLRARVLPVALVAVGGFAGASLRYAVALAVPTALLGTLAVNVVGSFALGLLLAEGPIARWMLPRLQLVAGVGFLSSFTTYSTFAHEVTTLAPGTAVGYVAASYGLAFVAVLLAHAVARWHA